MANKIIKNTLKHYYYDEPVSLNDGIQNPLEPDKTKSISELSSKELFKMLERLRGERELQEMIKDLKRNSGERATYEDPFKVDTTTPINQLYHYGILGQKWGVRRYQNEDGTRTPRGKKRDRDRDGRSKSEDHSNSRTAKSKGIEGLSNDELKKLNERLQLEETYKRLTAGDIQKSESWVKKSIAGARDQAVTEFSKGVMLGAAKLLVKEISPEFAETAFKIKDKKD